MPNPIFDIEQYELRNLVPEVYTRAQKDKLNSTIARVNGQIDWTAQLLGFNGPNYWGLSNRKADGTYNWKGLPETVNQKRRMQVGAFAVYDKDKDYEYWPAPFNRKEIAASGDASFHISEKDGYTVISPLNQKEGVDYMHDPAIFAGGVYIFDAEIEVEGREVDVENFIQYYSFLEVGSVYTRLRALSESMGGTLLVKIKGSDARPAPLDLLKWEDISDWNTSTIRRQFIGMWGNKGNQLSMDFAFDALDLYGNDERFSLERLDVVVSFTPEQLLERVGLKPTYWSNVSADLYRFTSENCGEWSAVNPYQNGPLRGFAWEPNYVEDEIVILDCKENCDYNLSITQVLSEEDDYDNGEYESFPSPDTIYNNAYYEWAIPLSSVTEDNGNYASQPPAGTTIDEVDYDHFPRPTEGFEDSNELIKPIENGIDNGFIGGDPPPSGRIDEGQYDRNPWRSIERFDIRYVAKTDYGKMLPSPCLEWKFNPSLDNGDFDFVFPDPLALQPDNEYGGPVATADDGFYNEDLSTFVVVDAIQGGLNCEDGNWKGYDDGVYDSLIVGSECEPKYQGCEADGGTYSIFYEGSELEADCSWECPPVDNERYKENEVFTGEIVVDGGQIHKYDYAPPGGCPVEDLQVNISDLIARIPYVMRPNLRNALIPLRTWKHRPLVIKDAVDTAQLEYWNYIEADRGTGPDDDGAFRHFVRLPLNYPRDGREWNKAIAVCDNQSYFSSPSEIQKMDSSADEQRPLLYSEVYREKIKGFSVIYEEDFLVSSISSDTEEIQPGFEDGGVTLDPSEFIPFDKASVVEYDPFQNRIPYANGEWRGNYFSLGLVSGLTGHLSTDLKRNTLLQATSPVYDESIIKRPNLVFPGENQTASAKNHVVSYAYFACDYSASDDPVFDPDKPHCWRQKEIGSAKPNPDSLVQPRLTSYEEYCVADAVPTSTAYLLHPTL